MLFFCSVIQGINGEFSILFNKADEENDEEREEQSDEDKDRENDSADETDDGGDTYKWLSMVDCVSETTRENWDKVFEYQITQFFNILIYRIEKDKREEEKIKNWKHNK